MAGSRRRGPRRCTCPARRRSGLRRRSRSRRPARRRRGPGASVAARGRKRLEVFLARRTDWPAGIASYDAVRRATAASWAACPVSTDGNLLRAEAERRGGPVGPWPRWVSVTPRARRDRSRSGAARRPRRSARGGPRSPVPGMASTCGPSARFQAIRTCAGVAPWASAICSDCVVLLAGGVLAGLPRDGEERDERDAGIATDGEDVTRVGPLVAAARGGSARTRSSRRRARPPAHPAPTFERPMWSSSPSSRRPAKRRPLRGRRRGRCCGSSRAGAVEPEGVEVVLDVGSQVLGPRPVAPGAGDHVAAGPDLGRRS